VGLTLVRHLVELHGGAITAASDGLGRGSTFRMRLPAIPRPAGIRRPSLPAAGPPSGPRRVLLVEDNADGRAMLADLLELEGHEVYEAPDGPQGVESALRLRPDLTLVDIGLPGFDGYEVARRIRRDPAVASLRLVALTGYGRPEDREQALAAGYEFLLVKPVDPATLRTILGAPRQSPDPLPA
jgi:CheY-like chemotaxis protein